MNYENIRAAFVSRAATACAATYPTMPLFFDNGPEPDLDNLAGPFVRVSVQFRSAEQINISPTPDDRTRGFVVLTCYVRDFTGTTAILPIVTFLNDLFKHLNLSGLKTTTPLPMPDLTYQGWYAMTLRVPFYVDSNM
jgi:hypothetical protein